MSEPIDLAQRYADAFDMAFVYADALIAIAAAFTGKKPRCLHCRRWLTVGCATWCPGLRARRILGIA